MWASSLEKERNPYKIKRRKQIGQRKTLAPSAFVSACGAESRLRSSQLPSALLITQEIPSNLFPTIPRKIRNRLQFYETNFFKNDA